MDNIKKYLKNKNKILILGNSGAGKTYFVNNYISAEYKAFGLDKIRFKEGFVKRSEDEIRNKLKEISLLDCYVIEGTFTKKLLPILNDIDCIIYLNTNPIKSVFRVIKRTIKTKGKRPEIEFEEKFNLSYFRFLWWVLNYHKEKKDMLKYLKPYMNKYKEF